MFTSQEYIDRKTGVDNLGRFEYLQALVTEFQDSDRQGTECAAHMDETTSRILSEVKLRSCYISEAKEQTLANIANFGYDPINYGHFRKLGVLDLFMGKLSIWSEHLHCWPNIPDHLTATSLYQ